MGSPSPVWVSLDKVKHKNQWGLKACGMVEGEDQIQTEHSASGDVLLTQRSSLPLFCQLSLKSISALGTSSGAAVKMDGAQGRRWRKRQGRVGFISYSSLQKVIYLILTSHLVCPIRTGNCRVDSNLWLYLQEDLHCKPTHFRLKIHYIAIFTEFQAGWDLIWNLWNKGLFP